MAYQNKMDDSENSCPCLTFVCSIWELLKLNCKPLNGILNCVFAGHLLTLSVHCRVTDLFLTRIGQIDIDDKHHDSFPSTRAHIRMQADHAGASDLAHHLDQVRPGGFEELAASVLHH